jgi:DNA modification methylase
MRSPACAQCQPIACICCITSPPYWGLRDYGVKPQIWGGDPDCRHRWSIEIVVGEIRTGQGLAALGARYRGGGHKQGQVPKLRAERGFCRRCGAWRGSLGLEPDYRLYVEHLVEVLREVRRVLRPDGSLWLNLGDSYATGAGKAKRPGGGAQGAAWAGKGPSGYRGNHCQREAPFR